MAETSLHRWSGKPVRSPPAIPTSNDLHELRAGHRQKGHLGLRRHRLGQKGLPAAGGPEQQRTFWDFGAQLKEALWALEKQTTARWS